MSMKNGSSSVGMIAAAMCMFAAVGVAEAATQQVMDGGVLKIEVDSGGTLTVDKTLLPSATSIEKTGAGEAKLPDEALSFTAPITIKAGTLSGYRQAFGTTSCITVEEGATLSVRGWDTYLAYSSAPSGREDNSKFVGAGKLVIGGNGVNNEGALKVSTWAWRARRLFTDVTFTADTTVALSWPSSGWTSAAGDVFDMGGHTLTVIGVGGASNYRFDWRNGLLKNAGDVVMKGGTLLFEGAPAFDATTDGKSFVLDGASEFLFYSTSWNASNPKPGIPLGLDVRTSANLNNGGGNTSRALNQISGPVKIASGKTLTDVHGATSLTLSGPIDAASGTFAKTGVGDLWLTGSVARAIGTLNVSNGKAAFEGGTLAVGTKTIVSGATGIGSGVARVVLDNGASLDMPASAKLNIGEDTLKYGIFEMHPGTAATNLVVNNVGYGAFYQFGGDYRSLAQSGKTAKPISNNGYGLHWIEEGRYTFYDFTHIANSDATGFLVQKGGFFGTTYGGGELYMGTLYMGGSNTRTHFYQSGGTNFLPYISANYCSAASTGLDAVITATGAGTEMESSVIRLNVGPDNAGPNALVVNVNDGARLTVTQIGKGNAAKAWKGGLNADQAPANTTTSRVYLNFNGGTLRAKGPDIFGNANGTSGCEPARVTVFERGATVDTQNYDVNWTVPFLAPAGRSIKRITLTDSAMLSAGYALGPVYLRIASASGAGATAIVPFDPNTRQLSAAAEITSPGWGFEEHPTVVAETSTNVTCTVGCAVETEAASAAGGLTKKGAGTLKVFGVNTYGGTTRLEQGTVAFVDPNGFPGGDIEIPSAALLELTNASAPLMVATNLVLRSGKAIRITEMDALDGRTFGHKRTILTVATPLTTKPELVLVDSDGTVRSSNGAWALVLDNGGRTLKFGACLGTMISIK